MLKKKGVQKRGGGAARTLSLRPGRQATANCKINMTSVSLNHLGSHHYKSIPPPTEVQNNTPELSDQSSQKTNYRLGWIQKE